MIRWQTSSKEHLPAAVANKLASLLETRNVTWFVSGGSNIALETETLNLLVAQQASLENLTILLIDERFGAVGHAESNWQLLLEAGFMIDGPTILLRLPKQKQL